MGVGMIFEGAYPYIPPSWGVSTHGLNHVLDEKIVPEVRTLFQSISEMEGIEISVAEDKSDEVYFIQEYLEFKDKEKIFSDLICVNDGISSLWTSEKGVNEIRKEGNIENITKCYNEKEFLMNTLKEKENLISRLEKRLGDTYG